MNELLLLAEMVVVFGMMLLSKKLFGKEGLYAWICLASVVANIQVSKSIDLFGISAVVGNVMFASVYLATNLLQECYGKAEARKGAYIGVASMVLFIVCAQITLLYIPSSIDVSHGAMATLFSLSLRMCAASLAMYAVSNLLNVTVYAKLNKLTSGKRLWLRSNASAILCNCLENYGFAFLAFAGIYPVVDVLMIATTGCFAEIFITLCSTPFMYIGKKV